MTTADKIRALAAKGMSDEAVAMQVGCTPRRVYLVRYEDENRARIRELRAKWNRKARSNHEYREAEREAQRAAYVAKVGGYTTGPYGRRRAREWWPSSN
jgi:hypothetical protein